MNRYLVHVGVGSMPREFANDRLQKVKEEMALLSQSGEVWAFVTTTDHNSVQIQLIEMQNTIPANRNSLVGWFTSNGNPEDLF